MIPYKFITNTESTVQKYEDADKGVCLVVDSPKLTKENSYRSLLMENYPTSSYNKRLIEGSIDLFVVAANGLRKNKKFDSELTEQDVNINFVHTLQSLSNLMGYFLNSTSWKDQELKDFDKQEIVNRLEKVALFLR